MNNNIIKTRNVSKVYNGSAVATHALREVNIDIPRGSFTAIVGPSGHGKSTLMHLIGCLDRPTQGSVFIGDADTGKMDNRAIAKLRCEKIGFVFQFFNLLQSLTAAENVETAMMLAGIPEQEQKERALSLLASVGLADRAGAKPRELSGGQQQRVAIARALANDPEVLLMDEPTGNLDSAAEAVIIKQLQYLHQQGKTVIIVTHNPDIAQKAEQVIRIRDGMVVT